MNMPVCCAAMVHCCCRPVPDAKSSPLAMFLSSKPVPLYSSRAATADADREGRLDALHAAADAPGLMVGRRTH